MLDVSLFPTSSSSSSSPPRNAPASAFSELPPRRKSTSEFVKARSKKENSFRSEPSTRDSYEPSPTLFPPRQRVSWGKHVFLQLCSFIHNRVCRKTSETGRSSALMRSSPVDVSSPPLVESLGSIHSSVLEEYKRMSEGEGCEEF